MKGFSFLDAAGSGGKRKVDLRGTTLHKSREELLEDARREREARQRLKERNTAALRLQAAWRGGRGRLALRGALRDQLCACYGDSAERLSRCV
jgi:hypothetical protein